MDNISKIIELINNQNECSVYIWGKIYRCKIDSFSDNRTQVLIKYDFTNTGHNYYYTHVPIKNLIL